MKKTKEQQIRLDFLNSHSAPVTRRDFLSLGFIGATGMALLPNMSWAQKMAQSYLGSTAPAFLVFDLAGGAALSGNFLVGGQGGAQDLLTSYDQLGWNPRAEGIDQRFGVPMAPTSVSKLNAGITQYATEAAQKNFKMGTLLHASIDDTSTNAASAIWLAAKFNSQFSRLMSQGLSQLTTQSGGNALAALAETSFKPMPINSIDDFINNFSFSGHLGQITPSRRGFLFDKIAKITKTQSGELSGRNRDQFLNTFHESFNSLDNLSNINTKELDPRYNKFTQNLYGINSSSAPTDKQVIISAITLNAILGNSGPSVITIGGCDYHNGNQLEGDTKDLEVGQAIGRAVELAAIYKKPLFIQIITDGGCFADQGTRIWRGDAGSKSMSAVGIYNPTATPKYIDNRMQIGSYTNGQGVERASLIGESPTLAACATFANYLNVCGRVGELEKYVPRGTFNDEQLNSLLMFDSIG